MIVIAGTITIDPTKRDEAFAAAKVIMEETHKEPGNIAYAFSADLLDDAVVRIFEEWESQEALDFHFKTPHMAEFQAKIGTLGVKDMTIKKYEVSSAGSLF
jgi:quinol monooxygenase YgiN